MTHRTLARLGHGRTGIARVGIAAVSVAALGLVIAGCDNGEDPTSSKGTTPSVVDKEAALPGASVQETPTTGEATTGAGGVVTASLKTTSGASAGTVRFGNDSGATHIDIKLENLRPGEHTLAIHQLNACVAADDFASAGSPIASAGTINVNVNANGAGALVTSTDAVKLDDLAGKTVVVTDESSGAQDASTAVACGVIGAA
ncbi:superoxide dismutase family protein [Gordonia jinhuaensis]|uniref:Superoxide dismutase [Cu-Zn] n=1 Tax=Gordonia jinhuaensis TaxID=1517702 RepID=A0A916WPH2_9ACTN|nr:superoxide dismutase family protein [Gordonia jinhuaensis]GGB20250.1 superoxide dismutase [Cu-Zn] [Gordonia jinhuaensis]